MQHAISYQVLHDPETERQDEREQALHAIYDAAADAPDADHLAKLIEAVTCSGRKDGRQGFVTFLQDAFDAWLENRAVDPFRRTDWIAAAKEAGL